MGLKEAKSKNIPSFGPTYPQKNKAQQDKLSKVEIMAECYSSTIYRAKAKKFVEGRKQCLSKNISIKNAIYFFSVILCKVKIMATKI